MFRCILASLQEGMSVRPSVSRFIRRSVRPSVARLRLFFKSQKRMKMSCKSCKIRTVPLRDLGQKKILNHIHRFFLNIYPLPSRCILRYYENFVLTNSIPSPLLVGGCHFGKEEVIFVGFWNPNSLSYSDGTGLNRKKDFIPHIIFEIPFRPLEIIKPVRSTDLQKKKNTRKIVVSKNFEKTDNLVRVSPIRAYTLN